MRVREVEQNWKDLSSRAVDVLSCKIEISSEETFLHITSLLNHRYYVNIPFRDY
jgi:hypothetical protein